VATQEQQSSGGSGEGEAGLSKVLGRVDVLALAFGAMIGFGWIVLTGDFLDGAGTLGAASGILIGAVVMGFIALTYAELVTAMPHTGGEHHYVMRALGSRAAFATSWTLLLGYLVVVAFEAVALPTTVGYLTDVVETGPSWTVAGYEVTLSWALMGIAAAAFMTWVNVRGVRPAAMLQISAVVFLLLVGIALLTGSFVGGSASQMSPLFVGGVTGLIGVLVATPFLFVGFDVIPQSAEEIDLPLRKLGTLLIVSVALAAFWYMMIMLTVGSSLPPADLVDSELAVAAGMTALWDSQLMGNLLVLGGIAGILTSWNGFLIGGSRLAYAMARSGMLPRWFGTLHPVHRTPSHALWFLGGLSMLAPLFGRQTLIWLVDAGGLALVVSYGMVSLSFIVLRNREPDMERPFRTPGGQVTGVIAVVLALALAVLYLPGLPAGLIWPAEWVIVGGWLLAGLLLGARVPEVGYGPQAHDRLVEATGR
jgi:amino acid transporter